MIFKRTINHVGHFRSFPFCPGIRIENLFEKRGEIDQVCSLSEILLCDLELHHQGCLRHCAKERVKRFAWLKIDGPFFTWTKTFFSNFPSSGVNSEYDCFARSSG